MFFCGAFCTQKYQKTAEPKLTNIRLRFAQTFLHQKIQHIFCPLCIPCVDTERLRPCLDVLGSVSSVSRTMCACTGAARSHTAGRGPCASSSSPAAASGAPSAPAPGRRFRSPRSRTPRSGGAARTASSTVGRSDGLPRLLTRRSR